jgi:hypothetical protein
MTEAAWSSVSMGDRLLCLACAERRMDRPLTLTDFTPIGNPEAICNRYRAFKALASALSVLTPHEQVIVGNCLAIYDAIGRSALADRQVVLCSQRREAFQIKAVFPIINWD